MWIVSLYIDSVVVFEIVADIQYFPIIIFKEQCKILPLQNFLNWLNGSVF